MSMLEVRISGFGGQGIILAGYIVGRAASIHDGRQATMVQAYGPEARGSACSSQVIIADAPIYYPYVTTPEILVCMSQEAYDKFAPGLAAGGTLLLDETLVSVPEPRDDVVCKGLPATQMAEDLGRKIVANIVMLGFFTGVTGAVSVEAMREAVAASVPKSAVDLNLAAFYQGYEYGADGELPGGRAVQELIDREVEALVEGRESA